MCGVCGVFNFQKPFDDASVIKKMADTMLHRGPDGEGYFLNSLNTTFSADELHLSRIPGRGNIVLGHRRLSIIDLEGGKQPLSNENDTVWVTYNGEIYNFPQLKHQLELAGHKFRTNCDTEVIVHAYEEWGRECVNRFRGMFVFAVWDESNNTLFIARDRLGIKPLYYYADQDKFVFASELKAICAVKDVKREINIEALYDYLTFLYVPAPKSIFDSIKKLPPGHTVIVTPDGMSEPEEYWDISFAHVDSVTSEQEWCERIIDKLRESVQIRLVSDVPLGAFLSGGVDSSAVVALMAELSSEPVKTTSIGFSDSRYDELEYAQQIVKRFGTHHNEYSVDADAVDLLEKLVWFYDEPFADSSALPTYLVSKKTREHVTVALSGDGGDENFAGYRRYYFDVLENRLRSIFPDFVRTTLIAALARIYPKADWLPQIFRAKTLLTNLSISPIEGYFNSMSWFGPVRQKILHPDLQNALCGYSPLENFLYWGDRHDGDDPLSKIQYLDIKTYLVDDILTKVDRASMANSLEVRVPVLDHEFMELAAQIPSNFKLNGKTGKYIFKKALEGKLPEEILYRKKMGFSIPLSSWLRDDLKIIFEERVLHNIQISALLNMDIVREMWKQHLSGMRDWGAELWAVLFFAVWLDNFMY